MNMRMGAAERMARVRDQEQRKASTRHARHVVRYRGDIPEAREGAILTLSVSLLKEIRH